MKLTKRQQELKRKHGTPLEFSRAVRKAEDQGVITANEANAGIRRYQWDWTKPVGKLGKMEKGLRALGVATIMAENRVKCSKLSEPERDALLKGALKTIRGLQQVEEESTWISVDHKPEKLGWYLGWTGGSHFGLLHALVLWDGERWNGSIRLTHWMPLPKGPQS